MRLYFQKIYSKKKHTDSSIFNHFLLKRAKFFASMLLLILLELFDLAEGTDEPLLILDMRPPFSIDILPDALSDNLVDKRLNV